MSAVTSEGASAPRRLTGAVVRLLVVLVLAVLGSPGTAQGAVRPLPVGTDFDYQLGGARSVPANVGIIGRDRAERPVPGRYNICYLNGFQTQVAERSFWRAHWDLVLKYGGRPVVDSAWGEWLLDTRTAANRARIAGIVGHWIDGCRRRGFQAVEFDNLDSFSRSRGLIGPRQNIALARLLVTRAHQDGLAAGQKNWADWNGRRVGYDFAIAEECGRWHECGQYVAHYGSRVLVIEYRDVDFAATCRTWGSRLAVVRRDLALSPAGVRRWC